MRESAKMNTMEHNETISYLKAVIFIASVDDSLSDKEIKCFNEVGTSYGLTANEIEDSLCCVKSSKESIESILQGLTTTETKLNLLNDLLALCYADGEYSVVEKNGMRDICLLMDIDESELATIEKSAANQAKKEAANAAFADKMSKAFEAGKNGSMAIGKMVASGSSTLAHSVASGVGLISSKISLSFESAKKAKEENKKLREELKTNTISEAVKQKVILQLNTKIKSLAAQLKAEKRRNEQNEEMIRLLQAQLEDLCATMDVAQNAKSA